MGILGIKVASESRARPGLIATVLALGVAVVVALITGSGSGQLAETVERASSLSGGLLRDIATALPFGYAFSAGMIAAVNPCGFALLPAYLGYYLGDNPAPGSSGHGRAGLARAAWVSAMVSAGFVLLFGAVGLIVAAASSAILSFTVSSFAWVGLAVGVMLAVAGGRMLDGASVYTNLGDRVASRLGSSARQSGARGYLAYGVAYGAASLGCTLPIFIVVMLSAISTGGWLQGTLQFLLYALGMAFVITVLTLSTTFFKYAAFARVRSVGRWIQPISAALLLLAGAYITYYWLTLGGILDRLG